MPLVVRDHADLANALVGMRSRLGPEASGVHASCRRAVCDREAVLQPEDVPGRRACPSAPARGSGAEFRPDRFQDLSPDGRLLIIDWARRAEDTQTRAASRGPNGQGSSRRSRYMFEAFIYAWISFNGWASCCCDKDRDRVLINVLRIDDRISAEFNSLVLSDPTVAGALHQFRALWPIFRATDVRSGLDTAAMEYRNSGRAGLVAYYSHRFPDAGRSPDCHLRHDPGPIVADWAHTLEALYRVRCNLFHGTKSVYGDVDREVVDAASAVLVPVVKLLVSHPFT